MNEYDTQLRESVEVRRRRLRDAVMFGTLRSRRTYDQNLLRMFIGLVVAAVIAAGAVGWSFFEEQRAQQAEEERRQSEQLNGLVVRQEARHGIG
jgi:hypothetical protein